MARATYLIDGQGLSFDGWPGKSAQGFRGHRMARLRSEIVPRRRHFHFHFYGSRTR
jgi:hypothetical protein